MSDRPETPLLDQVQYPADIRQIEKAQLPQLADELRSEMISAVSQSGGHLGSGRAQYVATDVVPHLNFDGLGPRVLHPQHRLDSDGHQAA